MIRSILAGLSVQHQSGVLQCSKLYLNKLHGANSPEAKITILSEVNKVADKQPMVAANLLVGPRFPIRPGLTQSNPRIRYVPATVTPPPVICP